MVNDIAGTFSNRVICLVRRTLAICFPQFQWELLSKNMGMLGKLYLLRTVRGRYSFLLRHWRQIHLEQCMLLDF